MAEVHHLPPPRLTPQQEEQLRSVEPQIKKLASNLFARRGRPPAEDLEQIGRIEAWKHIPDYREELGELWRYLAVPVRGAMLTATNRGIRQRKIDLALQNNLRNLQLCLTYGDGLRESIEARRRRLADVNLAVTASMFLNFLIAAEADSAENTNPEELLLKAELRHRAREALDEALASLDPTDRRLVILCTLEGRTFKDAGSLVDVDEHGARYRYYNALARLGTKLKVFKPTL